MRAVLLVFAVLLLFAVPAQAATPFQITTAGEAPDVVVDGFGTASVVWDVDLEPGVPHQTHYCRILPGRRGCAAGTERVFAPDPGCCVHIRNNGSGSHVFLASGRVIVVTSRCCPKTTYRFSSADGGATFDAGLAIGTIGADEAALGPPGIATIEGSQGTAGAPLVQLSPLDGPQATGFANLAPDTLMSRRPSVGFAPDGRMVAAWADSSRLNVGVLSAGAAPTDPAWTISGLGRRGDPILGGGGGALWLLHSGRSGVDSGYRLRRFSTRRSAFGKARTVAAPFGSSGALAVDRRGEAHVVYQFHGVWYRRTRHHGRLLTKRRRLSTPGLGVGDVHLSVGGHKRALLVWGPDFPQSTIHAVWLPRR
jgi:hypothetical protein